MVLLGGARFWGASKAEVLKDSIQEGQGDTVPSESLLKFMGPQGNSLTGHMSSHMADKGPGDSAGDRCGSVVFCSDSLAQLTQNTCFSPMTLAFERDYLIGCPCSPSVSYFLGVSCCLVLCCLFDLRTRRNLN